MADYWTISALGNSDGIGNSSLTKTFATKWTFPAGQNGANAGTYLRVTNTPPTWTTNQGLYTYLLSASGRVKVGYNTEGSGACSNGSDADVVFVVLPLAPLGAIFTDNYLSSSGRVRIGVSGQGNLSSQGTAYTYALLQTDYTTNRVSNTFTTGTDDINIFADYPAF